MCRLKRSLYFTRQNDGGDGRQRPKLFARNESLLADSLGLGWKQRTPCQRSIWDQPIKANLHTNWIPTNFRKATGPKQWHKLSKFLIKRSIIAEPSTGERKPRRGPMEKKGQSKTWRDSWSTPWTKLTRYSWIFLFSLSFIDFFSFFESALDWILTSNAVKGSFKLEEDTFGEEKRKWRRNDDE